MIAQGSPEWFEARLGHVTASRMADVTARTKSGWGASRATYMTQLMIERLTGMPQDSYQNEAMRYGTMMEPEAVTAYEFWHDVSTEPCGYFPHPDIACSGASPDRLVGDRGLVEVKCPNSATHVETLLSGAVPDKYIKQMHWQMACTGAVWVDYVSYDCRLPQEMQLFTKRIERDDREIKLLEHAVVEFLHELDDKLDALKTRYLGHTGLTRTQLQTSLENLDG